MLQLLSDENFNGDIIRGLLLRHPHIDLVRVQDVGLLGADDPEVLEWAAAQKRILLTHDRATMPDFAYERIRAEKPMPGMFVFNDRLAIQEVIQEVLLLDECTDQHEWTNLVVYPPL